MVTHLREALYVLAICPYSWGPPVRGPGGLLQIRGSCIVYLVLAAIASIP